MKWFPPDIIPLYDLQENDVFCVKQIIKTFVTYPSIKETKKNIKKEEKRQERKPRSRILTH